MSEFTLTRIDRMRYKPTKPAEEFLKTLRSSIVATDKATMARIAIARSLYEHAIPTQLSVPEDIEWGNAIEGVHLFGDDHDLWACLICESLDRVIQDGKEFQNLVEAHWHRGALLLQDDFRDVAGSVENFIIRMSSMIPNGGAGNHHAFASTGTFETSGPMQLMFGSTSTTFPSGDLVRFILNAPGTSPHIAILGKTRSGKSRTGLEIISQLVRNSLLPLIVIDPKGEYVKNGQLVQKPEWDGGTLERYLPGIQPLEIPLNSVPLDFLYHSGTTPHHELARIASSFKDSFQKCIKARGDVVLNLLREAVLDLLSSRQNAISLSDILERYRERVEEERKTLGGIGAKLSEIEALRLFEPSTAPSSFFSKRWVLSFGNCTEEPTRLAIFLILDALNTYLMSLPDSSVDANNHRALRHLLVVDEARDILSYKHGALSSLIRKSASRGGVTMLLSQGPDDFDQEEDDFLEQMGVVGVFASSASNVKNLAGTFGKRMRVEDFSDKALPRGVALVKLPQCTPTKITAWE